jgi:tricorn protease
MTRSVLSLMLAVAALLSSPSRAADAKAPPMLPDAPGRGYASHPFACGDRLVFVADGDIWSTKLAGGAPCEAARLTSGAGLESWPVISPDGSTLAFSADYDGNPEIYVMPITGGSPRRLTFHDSSEQPLTFTPDGKSVIFRSNRTNPLGRNELWQVSVTGGPPQPLNIGEASLAAIDPATGRIVFTRWSNENWHWKGYRGGTAPDLWMASPDRESFTRLTKTPENELFPMWQQGRIWFLSDTDGVMNLWSIDPSGGGRTQHTFFAAGDLEPRWASADPGPDGHRIVFARGGEVIAFDTKTGQMQVLDVRLIGDRLQSRPRFEPVMTHADGLSLAPGGKRLAIESRGQVAVVPVNPMSGRELNSPIIFPDRGGRRDRDVAWLGADQIAYISDVNGQSDIMTRCLGPDSDKPGAGAAAAAPASGESKVQGSESWLYPPATSLDGMMIAWGTKTGALRVLDLAKKTTVDADTSVNGAITDYRFSPDSKWLAWSRPLANGMQQVVLRNLQTGATTAIGDGMTNDFSPRWDPAGLYLYFLSDRSINPTPDRAELNFANLQTTQVCVVPLSSHFPPPLRHEAALAGMDMEAWKELGAKLKELPRADVDEAAAAAHGEAAAAGVASKPEGEPKEKAHAPEKPAKSSSAAEFAAEMPQEIETANISSRVSLLPIAAGTFDGFEAIAGGVLLGRRPLDGVLDQKWPAPPMGQGGTKIEKYDLLEEKTTPFMANAVEAWTMDPTGATVAAWDGTTLACLETTGGEPKPIETKDISIRVEPRAEWRQIFEEAWRLQRDFFWREDMNGVDWSAVRERYRPLVDRVGTRGELNDVIGEMMSELRNSHAYVSGGDDFAQTKPVSVGSLGADLEQTPQGWRIARILPDFSAVGGSESPLAKAWHRVKPGQYLLAVDGRAVDPAQDPAELLVDKGAKVVRLLIADAPDGANGHLVEVTLLSSDHALRYADWVDRNRRRVAELSGGALGYMHLPDMDSEGLIAFMRAFYPQTDRQGMLVDIRDNGGGYISQVLVEKLARKPWAYTVPREGRIEPYPTRVIDGPVVVLMDQGAGSDGDIFPESMRLVNHTTLVGTRTWGGVVGIDADKGFLDGGMSTQPGYGFWNPKRGYKVENEGVAPDVEMEWAPQDQRAGRDTQLEKAVEVLMKQMPPKHEMPVRIRKGASGGATAPAAPKGSSTGS